MLKEKVIIGGASRCCFKSVSVKNVTRKVYIFRVVVFFKIETINLNQNLIFLWGYKGHCTHCMILLAALPLFCRGIFESGMFYSPAVYWRQGLLNYSCKRLTSKAD